MSTQTRDFYVVRYVPGTPLKERKHQHTLLRGRRGAPPRAARREPARRVPAGDGGVMATKEAQSIGYWLTPAGCMATGGHVPHPDGGCTTCTVCGTALEHQEQSS